MHEKARLFFTQMATGNNITEESVKINKGNNYSQEDADFILQYTTKETTLLDIASGTGLLINKIYPYVKRIVAVELFRAFTQFIVQAPNITLIHHDITTFVTKEQFDIITFFGIMHYFNKEEAYSIYQRYYHNVKRGGIIVIKQQFGVNENVYVETKFGENKSTYYSEYRTVETEIDLLYDIGYTEIEIIDIYPQHYNKWQNTHFYALTARV